MGVNLSIKDVPDRLAQLLRERAARNHRSLQGELMAIIERAVEAPRESASHHAQRLASTLGQEPPTGWLTLEQIAKQAESLFPAGTEQFGRSVDIIREMRDSRDGNHWRG